MFGDYVDGMYPIVLEIKDTTGTTRSAAFRDLHLEIDNQDRLRIKLYKTEMISLFQLICSYIQATPVYGVYNFVDAIFQRLQVFPIKNSLVEGCC